MGMLDNFLLDPTAQFGLGLLAANRGPSRSAAFQNSLVGGLAGYYRGQEQTSLAAMRQAQAQAMAVSPQLATDMYERANPKPMTPYQEGQLMLQDEQNQIARQKLGMEKVPADVQIATRMFPGIPESDALKQYYESKKNPLRGGARLNPETGEFEVVFGSDLPAGTKGKMAGEAMAEDRSGALLKQIEENYDPSFLTYRGQFSNAAAAIAEKAEMGSKSYEERIGKYRAWQEGMGQYFNEYRRYVTGAAAAVLEMQSILDSILNKDLSPSQYKASWKTAMERHDRAKAAYEAALDKGLMPGTKAYGTYVDAYMAARSSGATEAPKSEQPKGPWEKY